MPYPHTWVDDDMKSWSGCSFPRTVSSSGSEGYAEITVSVSAAPYWTSWYRSGSGDSSDNLILHSESRDKRQR
jgi:hypothetical protein